MNRKFKIYCFFEFVTVFLAEFDSSATIDGFVVHKSKGITTLSSMQRGGVDEGRGDERGQYF